MKLCVSRSSLLEQKEDLRKRLSYTTHKLELLQNEFDSTRQYLETELRRAQEELDKFTDKLRRIQSSYSALQRINQDLEEKIHRDSQHHDDEKRALSREIIVLNNHLMEAKLTIEKLQEDNDVYRKDCSLAVQLLQCNKSLYRAQLSEGLLQFLKAEELVENVRSASEQDALSFQSLKTRTLEEMFPLKVSFLVAWILSICEGRHDNICNVEPKDLQVEEGSSVRVTCQSSCVQGKIFWTINNNRINESIPVNATHTALFLRNFTRPSATLQCHSSYTDQVLGGTTIRTFSKPKNISCVILHISNDGAPDLLTCTWEHQRKHSLQINYTLLLISPGSPSPTELCDSHNTSCTAETMSESVVLLFGNNYTVIVRAKTAAWEVDSDPFEFTFDHIWKINPPQVTLTADSDHLFIKLDSNPNPDKCQVKYHKESSSNNKTSNLFFMTDLKTFKIEDVESCVTYKLSARCALSYAPWSDWSLEKMVLTKLNKHQISLLLWRKVAEEGRNGKRNVHLMWKRIPSACEESISYSVEHNNAAEGSYTSCGSSACDVQVDQHAHRLYLRVSTGEGTILKESVYVPAIEESLPRVADIRASAHEGVIGVSWTAPALPVSGYIIDWTHNGSQYNWEKSTSTNATLLGLRERTLYNITVTPLLDDKTGHSSQTLHICSSTGVPEMVVIRNVQAYDTSALVSWDTESKKNCSSVISFTVFHKLPDGPVLNASVDGNKRDVLLKDLTPNAQYWTYVEARGHDGNASSIKRIFTTKMFDPRLLLVLSVSGSILLLLLLFFGLCCIIQWKKFSEKPIPNPGLSSVAKWLSQSHHKKSWFFHPFSNQSENIFDPVRTEETQRDPSLAQICDKVSDTVAECSDPCTSFPLDARDDWSSAQTDTQLLSSPEGSVSILSSGSSMNPYRSQSSAETFLSRTEDLYHCDSGKRHDKLTPKSVYVSLNMFEEGNVRLEL
ncbi:interleukin-31 receptor subunit alpha isoform X2 [Nothobranchius furzeri]|uniref:interleukin-31 receptor subunit alpha isoform X2 n=1 Tax=Nothobranchius furzeri TaxID=105023 RepID=UPI003904A30C